jgi:TRAP-type C4-dicarboxylate transport system substrate-binding protein
MKKRILALTLVFALAFTICALFTGCGEKPSGPNPDPTQKPVKATVLRASTPTAPDHPWTLGLQKIAEDVSERTGGRYKIDVYPNAHRFALQYSPVLASHFHMTTGIISPGSVTAR